MEESHCVFVSEYYWGENEYVTRAGKTSRNAHRLILSNRRKKWKILILDEFEVHKKWIKPLSSDPTARY